jgi:hypothetical protein
LTGVRGGGGARLQIQLRQDLADVVLADGGVGEAEAEQLEHLALPIAEDAGVLPPGASLDAELA